MAGIYSLLKINQFTSLNYLLLTRNTHRTKHLIQTINE